MQKIEDLVDNVIEREREREIYIKAISTRNDSRLQLRDNKEKYC